jgi:hypothetical protein
LRDARARAAAARSRRGVCCGSSAGRGSRGVVRRTGM